LEDYCGDYVPQKLDDTLPAASQQPALAIFSARPFFNKGIESLPTTQVEKAGAKIRIVVSLIL
jgi:hypothetical protein